jgi:hypothetical protein
MVRLIVIFLILISACNFGCKPSAVTVEEPSEPAPIPLIEQPVRKPDLTNIIVKPEPKESVQYYSFTLLPGPWTKYLSEPPQILISRNTTNGIRDLLTEEQVLIKAVLDADASVTETSEHSGLKDRLEELKNAAPSAETSSGHVRSNQSYRRTYISGDSVYTRSYPSYSYSVFREKQKSSSPALVRSVSGIAANTTLDDLDQRIQSLQGLISTWSRRTSVMSPNGTSGIMREANEAYIAGLRGYTKDFIQLRKELRAIEQAQTHKVENKAGIIQNWVTFEKARLGILKKYFEGAGVKYIEATHGLTYQLNEEQLSHKLILVCKIGQRVLYFELDERHHPNHPFILADVTTPGH